MGRVAFGAPRLICNDDQVEAFDCGIEDINAWLVKRGKKARSLGTAAVYVSTLENGTIVGFYALSMHSLERARTWGWLARNTPQQIPAVLLGMLAVNKSYQGQGLGEELLRNALRRAMNAAESIGAKALVVEPYNDSARNFYFKHGFTPVPGSTSLYAKLF